MPVRAPRSIAVWAVAIVCAGTVAASAEVRVVESGSGGVTIDARSATVREVLEALSESRTIRFTASDALSQVITGTYSGPLPRVLSRILDGYDHVIQSTASGMRINILGAVGSVQTGPSARKIVRISPNTGSHVSTNVDLDEENAQGQSQARLPEAAPPPLQTMPSVAVVPASARVSTNVDQDEEIQRR